MALPVALRTPADRPGDGSGPGRRCVDVVRRFGDNRRVGPILSGAALRERIYLCGLAAEKNYVFYAFGKDQAADESPRIRAPPLRSADFPVGCIADFQIREPGIIRVAPECVADLENRRYSRFGNLRYGAVCGCAQ